MLRSSLCDRYIFAEVDILNRVQESDSFFHRPLECLPAGNQTHASGAFVDYGGLDCFGQVSCPGTGTAAVDQAGAAEVAVDNLVTGQVDRVIRAEV